MVFLQLPNHDYSSSVLFCFGYFGALVWVLVTLGDHSAETTAFWIMAFFPSLNKHRKLSLPFLPALVCHLVPGLAASVFA